MMPRHLFSLLGLTALLLFLTTPSMATLVQFHSSDTLPSGWNKEIGFVAEGRIGNNGGSGTHELDIGKNTSGDFVSADFAWNQDTAYNFELSYDGFSSGTLVMDSTPLTYDLFNITDEFDGLALRTRTTSDSFVELSNLSLDGEPLGTLTNDKDGVEYLLVSQTGDLSQGFSLTGSARLNWYSGSAPTNSNLAFQIKGADAPSAAPVPEPASLLLLGSGLLGLLGLGQRRTCRS